MTRPIASINLPSNPYERVHQNNTPTGSVPHPMFKKKGCAVVGHKLAFVPDEPINRKERRATAALMRQRGIEGWQGRNH
jgi:hypothetical protein